jgi:hypothetical protein
MARRPTIAAEGISEAIAVRAVLIDPTNVDTFVVSYVHVPTRPPHPLQEKSGRQLAADPVAEFLGSRVAALEFLWAGEVLLTVAGAQGPEWWLGPCGPYYGRGLILRWDPAADEVSDTLVELRDIGEMLCIGDDEEASHDQAA